MHSLQIKQIYNLIRELASSASEDQHANFQNIVVLVNQLHNVLICAEKMRGLKCDLKLSFLYKCIDSSKNHQKKVEGYKNLMEEVLRKQLSSRNFQVLKILQSAESTWEEYAKLFQELGIELGLSSTSSTWIHQFILKYCLLHSQPQLIFSLLKQINEQPDTPIINIDHDTISGICLQSLIQKFNDAQFLTKEAFQFNIQVLKFLQSFNQSDKQVKFQLFLNQFIVTMMAQFKKELNPRAVRESMKSVTAFMTNFEEVQINEANYQFILNELLLPAAELSRFINLQDLLNSFVLSLLPQMKDLVLLIVAQYNFANLVFVSEVIPKLQELLTRDQLDLLLKKLMYQEQIQSQVLFQILQFKVSLKFKSQHEEEDQSKVLTKIDFISPECLSLKLIRIIESKEVNSEDFTRSIIRSCMMETESLETCIQAFKKLPLSISLKTNIKRTLYILEDIMVADEVLRKFKYRSLFPSPYEQNYQQKSKLLQNQSIDPEARARMIAKIFKQNLKHDQFSEYSGRLKTIEIENEFAESMKKKDKIFGYFQRNDQPPSQFNTYDQSQIIDVFLSLASRSNQERVTRLNLRLIILLMHAREAELKNLLLLHQFLQENSWFALLFCQFKQKSSKQRLLSLVPEMMKVDEEVPVGSSILSLSHLAQQREVESFQMIPLFHLLRRTNFLFLKKTLRTLLPENFVMEIYELKRKWVDQ